MRGDWYLIIGAIVASVLVIPGFVLSQVLLRGTLRIGGSGYLAAGLVAMVPGVLMGATGLWIAARG